MKFSGMIGFWSGDVEIDDGVWRSNIVEKPYIGELVRNIRKFQTASDQANKNLTINNQITILSDLYLRKNLDSIRYIFWNGCYWEVNTVEINYPRVTLEIGGVYHGETSKGTS